MKTAILIDGGYLRASSRKVISRYNNDFIEAFSKACLAPEEYLLRVLYYDAPRYVGKVDLPISSGKKEFQASAKWLEELGSRDRFAVRRGSLGFRGWRLKQLPVPPPAGQPAPALKDSDFEPVFEQKGVDMRIGLDIASMSERRSVDRITLVSGDQDMIPAMKHARIQGLEVVVVQLPAPTESLKLTIKAHADIVRKLDTWPLPPPSPAP